ncbi:hypothetical protein [Bacillus wiedmannii]|uniref:hypothetical protein n=1 Tax=Bacillus wiedmannii TaxID=1890302 RepID=UPI000BFDCA20|nr:hypothetical protein [Bacillus wiedmannii]PHE70523.1 hypothetical protein COF77_25255 [Bacillus wiedmannii]
MMGIVMTFEEWLEEYNYMTTEEFRNQLIEESNGKYDPDEIEAICSDYENDRIEAYEEWVNE